MASHEQGSNPSNKKSNLRELEALQERLSLVARSDHRSPGTSFPTLGMVRFGMVRFGR